MACIYAMMNDGCGKDHNCKGCKHDPTKSSPLTYDELEEEGVHLTCGSCIHFNGIANMDSQSSTCKRLDHKHFSFYKNPFLTYASGYGCEHICADFEPKSCCVWLHNHWRPQHLIEYGKRIGSNEKTSLCIDHDWSVIYKVSRRDFFYNTFINADGTLKWISKEYMKRKNGFKRIVTEYNKELSE